MFIFANNMQQSVTVRSESFNSDREASAVCAVCRARGVGLEPGPGRSLARAPDRVQFRHTGPDPGRRARQRQRGGQRHTAEYFAGQHTLVAPSPHGETEPSSV